MNTLILSSYFSVKPHPNLGNFSQYITGKGDPDVFGRGDDGRVWQNDFNYIRNWYDSIVRNKLKAVLFYDNLEDSFVNSYQNDFVTFKKVSVSEYSNNDWRFFCFLDFLKSIPEANRPKTIFHTDASDVTVVKDPHELVHSKEMSKYDYFACRDSISLMDFGYLQLHKILGWESELMFRLNINDWWLINMGVVGGKFDKMLLFYEKFTEIRRQSERPELNIDMWILQYMLRSELQPHEFIMGEPVCSDFKKYQNDRKDVYFIHK